ncbi:MAG: DMT family transporter [Candidatus Odinarchaeota archaeon]
MVVRRKIKVVDFWLPLMLAIVLYSIGDALLKQGNVEIASTFQSLFQSDFWMALTSNLPIIFAFSCALASKLVMGYVLAKNPLGLSEGIFIALSVVLTFIFGVVFFKEQVDVSDAVGIIAIVGGILFLFSSYENKEEAKINDSKMN